MSFRLLFAALAISLLSGCAGMLKSGGETALFALEIPTVEAAANRGAVASSLVRVNQLILTELPISSDAAWPAALVAPTTDEQKKSVRAFLAYDPWYATHGATGAYQVQHLGGGYLPPTMSPLAYEALKKNAAIFGDDSENWPDIWRYQSGLKGFLKFPEKYQVQEIEAIDGSYFPNIQAALISLMPVNLQKDLEVASLEYQAAVAETLALKQEAEEIKNLLQAKPGAEGYQELDAETRQMLQEQLAVTEQLSKEAEAVEKEKEQINFALFDQANEAMKSEINLDPVQVALAQNIFYALQSVKEGATHAQTLYSLATTSLIGRGALQNFQQEVAVLLATVQLIPAQADLIAARTERLVHNTAYLLPAIGMGTYYASKQNSLASKYIKSVEVILAAEKAQNSQKK